MRAGARHGGAARGPAPTPGRRCVRLPLLLALLLAPAAAAAAEPGDPALRDAMLSRLHDGAMALYTFGTRSLGLMLFDAPDAAFTPDDTYAGRPDPSEAGVALMQIAGPVGYFEASGRPGEALAGAVLAARIQWGAGDAAGADARLLAALARAEAAGLDDRALFSALADAAELERRAGRADSAARLLARARACGRPDCPGDAVLALLAAAEAAPEGGVFDVESRLRDALAMAGRLLPGRPGLAANLYRTAAVWAEDTRPEDAARYAELGFRLVEPTIAPAA